MTGKIHLDRAHLHGLLRQMLRIRRFEARCVELYQAQKIRGFLHLYDGEEAIAAGVMAALEPRDAVVATYHEHDMSIANQRILIIGGGSGMGLASARRLVQAGADVFIAGRDTAGLDAAVTSLGGRATGIAADFTDPASLEALMRGIGRLDHLVLTAAGAAAGGPFAQLPVEAVRTALNTKLFGYWQSLQAALPILRRDGSVVFMTGAASRVALNGTAGLAAVNGGITQMAQTLAKELAPLRVNVVSPGLVDTPAYDGMPAEAKAGMFAGAAKSLPVGPTGVPDDIAQCVEMLVGNTFATGMLLDIDGGARTPL